MKKEEDAIQFLILINDASSSVLGFARRRAFFYSRRKIVGGGCWYSVASLI